MAKNIKRIKTIKPIFVPEEESSNKVTPITDTFLCLLVKK